MSKATDSAIATADLIIAVDATRTTTDPFKLPAAMLALVVSRRATEVGKTQTVVITKGTRTGASGDYHLALEKLDTCHHDGYNYITGLTSDSIPVSVDDPGPHISTSQRAALYESYGFAMGLIGKFTVGRIITLAALVPVASAQTLPNPAWLYPETLQAEIAAQLTIVNDNKPVAGTGSRQVAVNAQDAGLTALLNINARVRFFYCQASDDLDSTPELSRIGSQPRRASGAVKHKPVVPSAPTFDKVGKTLAVLLMPQYATTLQSWKQAAGGVAEHAGTSDVGMPIVSLTQYTPLVTGTAYTVWVVGHNSLGDGPASSTVTFTA